MTKLDIPVEKVLAGAANGKLAIAVVIGVTEEGEEYFASSDADAAEQLWLIERFKFYLMHQYDADRASEDAPA